MQLELAIKLHYVEHRYCFLQEYNFTNSLKVLENIVVDIDRKPTR